MEVLTYLNVQFVNVSKDLGLLKYSQVCLFIMNKISSAWYVDVVLEFRFLYFRSVGASENTVRGVWGACSQCFPPKRVK